MPTKRHLRNVNQTTGRLERTYTDLPMYGDALDRFMDWAKFLDLHNDDIWEIGEITFDHFGRESSSIEGRTIDYLNSGDTYDATLIRDDGDVYVGTWGDWVEQVERDIAEREERYRCGWCGEFTELGTERRDKYGPCNACR
jgi:hypothetical protein